MFTRNELLFSRAVRPLICRNISVHSRKGKGKCRAPVKLALDCNLAAVGLDNMLDYRKPYPTPRTVRRSFGHDGSISIFSLSHLTCTSTVRSCTKLSMHQT